MPMIEGVGVIVVYWLRRIAMLGVDRIHKWAAALGLGEKTGIDLPERGPGARAVDRVEARRG